MKITITITNWNEGFNKVQFNKFLRGQLSYTIHDAKKAVENILNGEEVILELEYDSGFIALLDKQHVEYKIEK